MKALKYFASALALIALFTACEEPNNYVPAELPGTQEAYFPATAMTVSMEELATGFEVELARVNYDEAATATLVCQRPEGVNVPSSVSFKAGQEKTSFTVSVDQAAIGEGKSLKVVINVDGDSNSPYANQRCTVTLTTWSPEPPVTWEPIETEAMFRHNIIGMWFSIAEQTYDVYVEKRTDCEMYRIANAFTYYKKDGKEYHYPYYSTGDEVEPLDPVVWTVIDCSGKLAAEEGYTVAKNSAWVPLQTTNNDWGYGEMLFASLAFNLSTSAGVITPDQYPIGIYDPATKSIALGCLGCYLPGYGWQVDSSTDPKGWPTLYLDKNLMGTDFERDCAFEKIGDGTYYSVIAGGKWAVELYEGVPADEEKAAEYAEEFGRVFAADGAYAEGYPIYFCEKDGKVSVPEDYQYQEMGQSFAGFDLYLNIKKGTFENNVYSLECAMVGIDPAGVKADVVYGEYTEKISLETAVAAESIDDFCGEWDFAGIDANKGEAFTYPVTIEKVSATEAKLKYLLDPTGSLDDGITLTFVDGELSLVPQDLGITTPTGYDVVVNTLGNYEGSKYFFEPATPDYPFAPGMMLQLTSAGII
ncbi:MAG: hypothetical protein IKU92_03225 [Rikenellaceae bacterium]|nr:hypothetical protein [Rikenellaceae bacterium]